ncbi:MAG: hypothetical protein LUD17_03445 [Bacteroidales bacterium]|nr:hypothetical protein [Bacteroidales bacterium]
MRRFNTTLLAVASLMASATAMAQSPDIVMRTESYGSENAFTIVLGSTEEGYVQLENGGWVETFAIAPAVYDEDEGAVTGTAITCELDETCTLTITALDGIEIDYLNASGCYLTSIEFAHPEDIDILNLEHNYLTKLDCSGMVNAQALYLGDNTYDETPLIVGGPKPYLTILDISIVDNLDPNFSLTNYPALQSFDAMSNPTLTACDPSQCPSLKKLSIDATNVSELDLSGCPELRILNISDTGITDIDLSKVPLLQQLYCDHMSGSFNAGAKLSSLDVTANPELIYLFASGNEFTSIDLSKNPQLQDLFIRHNKLTSLDLSNNPYLYNVMISYNDMDFSTLPLPEDTWGSYEYQQNAMSVPKSFQVGSSIDLSKQTTSPNGVESSCVLYYISPSDPATSVEVDASKYAFADGILTINQVVTDSVYACFYNDDYPDCYLATTMMKVKSSANYGQDDLMISMNCPMISTTDYIQLSIGMDGATEENPKTFYVDFGNGTKVAFSATSWEIPSTPNVNQRKGANGTVKIYVPENEKLTGFAFGDSYLSSIDVTAATELRQLSLTNTELYSIDLQWNRCLQSLTLTGNHFTSGLDLSGNNGGYNKNVLTNLNLSNNELSTVTLSPVDVLVDLDLSNNKLSTLDFTDAERITRLDLSNNAFDYLKLSYLSALTDLDLTYNVLTELVMPETNIIETMDIRYNYFTLANMPDRNGLDEDHFIYAPQYQIAISAQTPVCNLSDQMVTVDGYTTEMAWITTSGETLTEGTDYLFDNGVTTFLTPAVGKKAYCAITNGAYPAFTGDNVLRTSTTEISSEPNVVIGQFTTPTGGQTVSLSLAGLNNTSIYIDWTGEGDLTQYTLEDTYTQFEATTTAGAEVKVYSYSEESDLTVFSVTNCAMRDVDLSGMNQLNCLTLNGANISEIKMPERTDNLSELFLPNNAFRTFDLAAYPTVQYCSFEGNIIESIDLTDLTNLQMISFSSNDMEEITFGNNPNLWSVFLSDNCLTEVDLSPLTALYQVTLQNNELEHIDLDDFESLHVVYLNNNRFTLTTLPLPRDQWTLYIYGNQAEYEAVCVDGVVDLSSQAMVGTTLTNYAWYVGYPTYDDELEAWDGELLTEGEDYTIDGGVTTFLKPYSGVCCLMTNDELPLISYFTTLIDVTTAGIADAMADGMGVRAIDGRIYADSDAEVFSAAGIKVGRIAAGASLPVPTGVYLIRTAAGSAKLMVR